MQMSRHHDIGELASAAWFEFSSKRKREAFPIDREFQKFLTSAGIDDANDETWECWGKMEDVDLGAIWIFLKAFGPQRMRQQFSTIGFTPVQVDAVMQRLQELQNSVAALKRNRRRR